MAGPSAIEQEFLQRINRLRVDPQGEYNRLISSTTPLVARDAEVQRNLEFFNTSGTALRSQWNALQPTPPLAWNTDLYEAAAGHTSAMIAANQQSHQVAGEPPLGQRLLNAGYRYTAAAENVFAFCSSILFCHAGLAIDWGSGPGGIQSPPAHRENLMSNTFKEVGVSVQPSGRTGQGNVGPLVATQNFGSRSDVPVQIVGAVYRDDNNSGWYDAGEGRGGATITFVGAAGTFSTTVLTAGGYQAALPPGVYEATVSGGAVGASIVRGGVTVGTQNRWFNFDASDVLPAPTAADETLSVAAGEPTLLDVLANDVAATGVLRGDSIRISVPSSAIGTWEVVAGKIRYTPAPGVVGVVENHYRVADASGAVSNWANIRLLVVQPGPTAWQNPTIASDVNGDRVVEPLDALLVINELNRRGLGVDLPDRPGPGAPTRYVDVDGNGKLEPLDALRVINVLNRAATSLSDTVLRTVGAEASAIEFAGLAADWSDIEKLRSQPTA